MYKARWWSNGRIEETYLLRGEIISSAHVEVTIIDTEIDMPKLWMDTEETDPDLFRMFEEATLTDAAFDGLLARTDEYGRMLIAQANHARA